MNKSKCDFCNPLTFADRTIDSNELAISLLSSPRLTPGHSLVVPRRHIERPDELSGDEVAAIHELISPLYRQIIGHIALGVDVWQKTRPFVKQNGIKMDHVHFHVIPSDIGDERYNEALRWSSEQFEPLREDERSEMLRLLSD